MTEDKKDEYKVKGEELLGKIKELIHEGNVRKVVIKDTNGKTYLEIPVSVGLAGILLAPVFAAIGAIAALAANFKIEIIKKDSEQKNNDTQDEVAEDK